MFTKLYVKLTTAFASDEGASAVEYGIMVALIAAVIVAVVAGIGTKLNSAFTTVNAALP